MKSKWNWGKGIVLLISGFVLLKILLVYIVMIQKVDMVTDNYYEKDLLYQQEINRQKNVIELNEDVTLMFSENILNVRLPEYNAEQKFNGSIYFYRPSDSSLDKQTSLKVDKNGRQLFDLSTFEKGVWKVQLKWSYNDKEFSYQQMIYI